DGGDECFGGYARHFLLARMAGVISLPPAPRRMAASGLRLFSPTLWQRLLVAIPLSQAFRATLSETSVQRLSRVLAANDEHDLYERLIRADEISALWKPSPATAGEPLPPARRSIRRI